MPNAEIDDAYANAAYIRDAEKFPAKWSSAAAEFRRRRESEGFGHRDLAYGSHPRQRMDLFHPNTAPVGLVVFVHGGFWKSFGKPYWSHLAAGPLAKGFAVAIPEYTLCPESRISEITKQIRASVEFAAQLVAGPIFLSGHSAGGHLVARLCCPDAALSHAVQARVVRVVAISGLFDLRPLLESSMNSVLGMDRTEAERESPVLTLDPAPISGVAWVGELERPVFIEQSRMIARNWPEISMRIESGMHHFNIIEGLESDDSALTAALTEIAC